MQAACDRQAKVPSVRAILMLTCGTHVVWALSIAGPSGMHAACMRMLHLGSCHRYPYTKSCLSVRLCNVIPHSLSMFDVHLYPQHKHSLPRNENDLC